MRKIVRQKLSDETAKYLEDKTARIKKKRSKAERVTLARTFWKQAKRTTAFDEIRRSLEAMATGNIRCMYCEDSRCDAIDHFWPQSSYPEMAFQWDNYLFACAYCNSNCKRDAFPIDSSGHPLLIDPTKDDPPAHLLFTPTTGRFVPRIGSKKARPTIKVFGLNERPELTSGRRDMFTTLQILLVEYAKQRRLKRHKNALEIER